MSVMHRVIAATCLALLLTGCGTSPPVRYFSLEGMDTAGDSATGESVVVGLGPVKIPGYLSRPQIVRRSDGAEIIVDDFRRWAEPLDQSVNRVVAANVESLVGEITVVAFPHNSLIEPDFRVHASVDRFDVDETGTALLVVQWGIVTNEREPVVTPRRIRYEALAVNPGDTVLVVEALNDTLTQFSRDIAAQLKTSLK